MAGVAHRAVIFDLGGVVFPSPLDAFRTYERDHDLPHRFLSEVVLADPVGGAWSRLERGELDLTTFPAAFEAECLAAGGTVDAGALMASIGGGFAARPEMLAAIRRIRAEGLRTAALTNNWVAEPRTAAGGRPVGSGASAPALADLFDVVVESAVVGLRKPDPAIYRLACSELRVEPAEAVFLDDLGTNLKPARAMGMATVKVGDPAEALTELAGILGFPLT